MPRLLGGCPPLLGLIVADYVIFLLLLFLLLLRGLIVILLAFGFGRRPAHLLALRPPVVSPCPSSSGALLVILLCGRLPHLTFLLFLVLLPFLLLLLFFLLLLLHKLASAVPTAPAGPLSHQLQLTHVRRVGRRRSRRAGGGRGMALAAAVTPLAGIATGGARSRHRVGPQAPRLRATIPAAL